jgi:hypothetical protein
MCSAGVLSGSAATAVAACCTSNACALRTIKPMPTAAATTTQKRCGFTGFSWNHYNLFNILLSDR